MKELYLAGGSFYGLQEVFSRIPGVAEVKAGYANSHVPNPSKEDVAAGKTGAVECIRVVYNPKKIDITTLLSVFFTIVNPYTDGIQGKNTGPQYRSGVYYTHSEDIPQIDYYMSFMRCRGRQKTGGISAMTVNDFESAEQRKPPIRTKYGPISSFYEAPEEEQNYLQKHPDAYTPIDIKLLEKLEILQ